MMSHVPLMHEAYVMQKMPRRPAQPALPYKRRRLVVARSEEDLCEVSVRAALREEDAQTVRWRLKLLARARALGINTRFWPREDGDGADVEVGPFLLRRSGRAGQSVEQFCAEVDRAKQSLNALLWCFACLSAQEGQEPEEDLGVACRVRDYLEQQLGQATSVVQSPAACARAEVLRSALGSLAVIIEDSQPLSEAHRKVFTSASAVLSPKQCRAVTEAAERHAVEHGWTRDRHMAYPTNDLPATAAVLGAHTAAVLQDAVSGKLLPELAERFQLDRRRLDVQEMFVAKYEAGGLPALEEHEDGSEFSFVLALNAAQSDEQAGESNSAAECGSEGEFRGGGTQFVHLGGRPTYRPPVGFATMFSGKNRHCGVATTAGVRYILAGFLRYK